MWSKKTGKHWHYNFLLKTINTKCFLWKHLNNRTQSICMNADDGCCLLQIICDRFIQLPLISGLILHRTSLSVGHGMRYHKLKLTFGDLHLSGNNITACGTILTIDPVLNLSLIDWWLPTYPHKELVPDDWLKNVPN